MSSSEKCLFKSFAHFLTGLFVFLEWSGVSSLHILEIRPLPEVSLANMFPYCWFSFHVNAVLFSHAETFYFDEVPFVYYFLYVPCFRGHGCVRMLLCGMSEIFLPMFSSRTFMVLKLTFKSFIHLEFIFVYGVSW